MVSRLLANNRATRFLVAPNYRGRGFNEGSGKPMESRENERTRERGTEDRRGKKKETEKSGAERVVSALV